MILKTFNQVKELDNLEDLTKLSNAERLELFGILIVWLKTMVR